MQCQCGAGNSTMVDNHELLEMRLTVWGSSLPVGYYMNMWCSRIWVKIRTYFTIIEHKIHQLEWNNKIKLAVRFPPYIHEYVLWYFTDTEQAFHMRRSFYNMLL